ncbi:MAG: hypothetical protein K9K75_06580 [Deltaproteobacteria bacterium]|nr:hypothetical protein [Deltaproteobacteria bacterium]
MMKKIIAGRIFLALFLFLAQGCGSGEQPCEQVRDKLDRRDINNLVHIYVDSSESMAGFIEAQGASPYKVFVTEQLPYIMTWHAEYKLFGFQETIHPVGHVSSFSRKDFYCGKDTLFAGALRTVIQEEPKAFMIISDLVVSPGASGAGERKDVIRLIHELTIAGYGFRLVGMKSPFQGRAYSESNLVQGVNMHYIGKADVADRPFYLLIGYKRGIVNPDSVVRLSDNFITEKADFGNIVGVGSIKLAVPTGSLLSKRKTGSSCDVVKWRSAGGANSTEIIFTVDIDDSFEFLGIADKEGIMRMVGQPRLQEGKKWDVRAEVFQGQPYYVVDFLFRPAKADTLPRWIQDWSTRDDSVREKYNLTYGLEDFVGSAMLGVKRYILAVEN